MRYDIDHVCQTLIKINQFKVIQNFDKQLSKFKTSSLSYIYSIHSITLPFLTSNNYREKEEKHNSIILLLYYRLQILFLHQNDTTQ